MKACLLIILTAICGCAQASPVRLSSGAAAEQNLADVLNAALKRGDRVKALPRGDYFWRWVAPGERWNFGQWYYEITP